MKISSQILRILAVSIIALSVSACGSTWEGVKNDTSKNLQKTGDALNKAGKKLKTD
ncbi:MAG: hypothetical protein JKY12_07405 [Sneathiella sp.]|nr:hypothetical protein [Sneathiella sp.]